MSGNTGKMTNNEIEKRGPRMVLVNYRGNGLMIHRDNHEAINYFNYVHADVRQLARSYSLSYLMQIAKAQGRSK